MRLALGRSITLTVTLALATLEPDDQAAKLLGLSRSRQCELLPEHLAENCERILVHVLKRI